MPEQVVGIISDAVVVELAQLTQGLDKASTELLQSIKAITYIQDNTAGGNCTLTYKGCKEGAPFLHVKVSDNEAMDRMQPAFENKAKGLQKEVTQLVARIQKIISTIPSEAADAKEL